ncbi:hypothetical protein [Acinetobacter sp.]|uniref:hypothetical protein n=1 Tax=Acinetobacter sp. TaxID=472 RepID=UPI00388F298E
MMTLLHFSVTGIMPMTHKMLSSSILLVLFTTLVGCNDDKAQVTTPQVETPLAAQFTKPKSWMP